MFTKASQKRPVTFTGRFPFSKPALRLGGYNLATENTKEVKQRGFPALRSRLSAVMGLDPHAPDGRYVISSLYFDTPDNRALREKLNGVSSREKFRLRYYNGDTSLILLEKKLKVDGLCAKLALLGLGPRVIVQYTREPFIYAPGNVRVTIDYHIRTCAACGEFLAPGCPTIPIPNDTAVLEVKWDSFLPSIIRDIVQTPGTRTGSFSKYAASRIYG